MKCHEEEVKIQMFFGKLKIKTVQILYRASDNLFDIERFHNICDNIPHTLTICETEFGKIVGGYTPIPWQTLEDWEEAKDETLCSFIFSLTNNDRFNLHQSSRAIIHRNDFNYGPQFGGGADLIIADKANINSNSFSRINTSYCNRNYHQYEKEGYKKFSGSETEFFRIK